MWCFETLCPHVPPAGDGSYHPRGRLEPSAAVRGSRQQAGPPQPRPGDSSAWRQDRPNLPSADQCPFCPGGLEAPEDYAVHWFKNRWPPLPDDRCEIVLFSPEHSQSLGSLSPHQLGLVVSLWAERTEALGARADVDYVLVFENRGRDVGATISHPHGQIYSFAYVPPVPLMELRAPSCAICDELSGKGAPGTSHSLPRRGG